VKQMNRAELVALASPPCHRCGRSVERVEGRWHLDEDNTWQPGPWFMVCGDGHRVLVKPLP
jgi:DNA-directed RNA polymerase subunit RPC12/RpoP